MMQDPIVFRILPKIILKNTTFKQIHNRQHNHNLLN